MSKRVGSCSRSPSPTTSSSKRRRIDGEGNLSLGYPDAPSSSGSGSISLIHGTSLAPPNGRQTSPTHNSRNSQRSTTVSLTCSVRSKSTEIDPDKPSVLSAILQIQSQIASLSQGINDLREEVTQMKEEVREARSEFKALSGSEGSTVLDALKEQKQDLSSLKFSVDSFRLVLGDSLGKSKTTGVSDGTSTQEEQAAWRSSFMKEMMNSRQGFGLFPTASQTFVPTPAASGSKRTGSHSTTNTDKSKTIQKATSTSQRPISTLTPRSSTSATTTSAGARSTSQVVTTAPRRVEKSLAGSSASIASTIIPSDTELLIPQQTQPVTPAVTVTSLIANSSTRTTRSSASTSASPTPRNTRSSTTSATSSQKLPLPSELTPSISAPLLTHTSLPASSTTSTPRLHDLWSAPPAKSSISVSNPSSTKRPGALLTHAQISATSTAETYNPDKKRRPRHVTAFGCKVPEEVGEEWEFELPAWILDGLEEVNTEVNHADRADVDYAGDEQGEDMADSVVEVEGQRKERYTGLAEKIRLYREWAKNNDCSYYSYWWWNTRLEAVAQGASGDASRMS